MVIRRFEEVAARYKDKIAVKSEEKTLTYHQLNGLANSIAHALVSCRRAPGLEAGAETVALLFDHGVDPVAALLAVLKAGKIYVPFDSTYPEERLIHMINDFDIGMMVTNTGYMEMARKLAAAAVKDIIILNIDDITAVESFENCENFAGGPSESKNPTAYIILTSGSGGKPKGVMQNCGNLYYFTENYIKQLGITSADRFSYLSSFSHDGAVEDIFPALLSGAALYPYNIRTRGITEVAKWLIEEQITVYHSVPTVFRYFASTLTGTERFPELRIICMGAETLRLSDIHIMRKFFSTSRLAHMYGQTESSVNTMGFIDFENEVETITIGKPLEGIKLFLVNEEGEEVEELEEGEIFVVSPYLSPGYWKDPGATAASFLEDEELGRMYKTGDLGRLELDGSIEFRGRKDDQLKIRGFRVEPAEIESRLLKFEAVKEAIVAGRVNKEGETYLCAYIVTLSSTSNENPGKEIDIPGLKDFLSYYLPDYMIPAYFVRLDRLPLTANGKVDRKSLPAPEIGAASRYVAPRTLTDEKLVDIWEKVLGVEKEKIGIDDNFFELGGHSLKATLLVSGIHRALNVKIPLAQIFRTNTIRGLSQYIKEADEEKYAAVEPVEKKAFYPLSSAQKRLFVLQRMEAGHTGYHIVRTELLEGRLDIDRLQATFRRLIQRHESLRTSFRMIDNQPVQEIHQDVVFEVENISVEQREQGAVIKDFVRPFDLSRAPLFRAGLIKQEQEKYILVVDMHHIIADGTSHAVLLQEFAALYRGVRLAPLRIQYKDYSHWQNCLIEGGTLKAQKDYWLMLYSDMEEILRLNLMGDYKRPEVFTFEGDIYRFVLEREEGVKFKALGTQNGGTLYMNLLATLNTLFYKYTGQRDIIIGSGIAGRPHADLQNIIGMFVNMLAMRNYPESEKTYLSFLKEVIDHSIRAFENQDVQFEELVDSLKPERDLSRNPLFDISMVVQNFRQTGGDDSTWKNSGQVDENVPSFEYRNKISRFDMTFFIFERGEDVYVTVEYYTGMFKEETIQRLASHLRNVINAVVKTPFIRLKDIEIIAEEEKRQVLYEFNDTAGEFPVGKTIHRLFEAQVERTPGHMAVIGPERCGESIERVQITYWELNEKANRLARYLCAGKGIQREDRVGIWMSPLLYRPVSILGVLKAGAAYVPIDPSLPAARVKYMIDDASIPVVISEKKFIKDLNRLQWECESFHSYLCVDSFDVHGEDEVERNELREIGRVELTEKIYSIENELTRFRYDALLSINKKLSMDKKRIKHKYQDDLGRLSLFDKEALHLESPPDSLAYIIYTSGTTGQPKGAMIRHGSLVNLCNWHNRYYQISEADNATIYAGFGFDASVWEMFPYLLKGASLHLIDDSIKLDIDALNAYYERNHINVSFLPTQFCEQFMNYENRSLRVLLTGGDKIRTFVKRSYDLYNNYGPTENTVVTTAYPVEKSLDNIPIGKPLDNTMVYILDRECLHPQPVGAAGELCIGGVGLARGYINDPELTAEKFISVSYYRSNRSYRTYNSERIYKTGDLARWLADGNIEFLGRIDYQVKIRGYRIELGEIESRLMALEGIKEAVVAAREDENSQKYLCAYIVSNREAVDISALRGQVSDGLPDYMVPAYFMQLEAIPLTLNGKVDWRKLPGPGIISQEGYAAPRDAVEEKLVEIWAEILNIEKENIGINSDFFDIGGHSLKATILVARIHKELDVKLPLARVFTSPTIKELSEYIRKTEKKRHISIVPTEEKEYYPLSSAQKRLYVLHQLASQSTYYNLPSLIEWEGTIDKDKLEGTFKNLIARHESLRTSFAAVNEEPVQRVHKKVDFSVDHYDAGETDDEHVVSSFTRPFDLSRAPLLRVSFVDVGASRRVLFFDMHHIITDGTSQDILIKEFMEFYRGKAEALPPLKLQYKDYSEWLGTEEQRELRKQQETHWLKEFAYDDELPVLNLPADYPRPLLQGFQGNWVNFALSARETLILKDIAGENDVTLYMILLAVFNVLFSKLSGQEDIVLGTPIAARRHTDLQHVIGMMVNTLPMRNYPSGDKQFHRFLKEVKQRTLEAYENQEYPFENLVENLAVDRDTSRNPVFDVMLVLMNQSEYPDEVLEMPVQPPYQHLKRTSRFDMSFVAVDMEENLFFGLEYSTNLFEPATIERYITYFKNIVRHLGLDTRQKISDIEYIPAEEKEAILELSSGVREIPAVDLTIHRVFQEKAGQVPDDTALVFEDQHLSYGELNRRSNQLARLLREKGVGAETVVGVMVERSIEMIVALLAVLKAGGAYLPIDPQYPQKRILSILEDTPCPILLLSEKTGRHLDFTALGNIREANVIPILTPPQKQIKNFDELPLPDRTLISYERYHQSIGIAMAKHTVSLQATRGCPYNCAYCHKIWPKTHVARSADNIFTEIRQLHDAGVKRFVFIDDIFNLKKQNAAKLLEKIITYLPGLQLFFPNGLRGDILDKEFIDLMVEAGTVNIDVALEAASPRIQKLIRKNLDIERFKDNVLYVTRKYPQVILEMELMMGFPTETEEEASMILDFIKQFKWLHFPNLNILKIFPNTDMYRLAVEKGVSIEAIADSTSFAYHELPDTLPYSKGFAREFQTRFMNEYMLSKERLLHILPFQVKILTEEELIRKYDSYFPEEINTFGDILHMGGIAPEEFPAVSLLKNDSMAAPHLREKMKTHSCSVPGGADAMRILLLDLSQFFSEDSRGMLYDVVEEPLGLMYLLTYLNCRFQRRIWGKIAKSRIDFDSYGELKRLILDFKPHLIGIRTLSYHKEFFHKNAASIREWGVEVPIIAGGPYATSDYRQMLRDSNINLAVLGEGELTLACLVEKMLDNNKKLPPEDELLKMPGIAFIKEDERAILEQNRRKLITVDNRTGKLAGFSVENLENINSPGDLLYLISTSGSTGTPKSVMLEHRNLLNLLQFQFADSALDFKHVLQFASIGFDVSAQEIFSTLLSGGKLFLIDSEKKHDIPWLFNYIRRNAIDTLFLPPAFLKFVFSEPEYAAIFPSSVKHIIAAGEQLVVPDSLRDYLKDNHVILHNHYGPSETHVVSALTIDPGGEIPGLPSIGKPIANTRLYILDKNKNLVPAGVPGELYISGDSVGRGYYNRERLTRERYMPDPFFQGERMYRSGDLARRLPDGNMEFLGRVDLQVKLRGYRIEPGEIETQLMNHPDVKEAVVTAGGQGHGHEYLCAYIVAAGPGKFDKTSSMAEELKNYLSRSLPDYMIPAYFVKMEKLPLTPSGKINRKALPKPERGDGTAGDFIAPRDEIEMKLASIWAEVLGIEESGISIDGNFFGLGGHSLKATVMTEKIYREFMVRVPLSQMFSAPTIRKLAGYLREAEKETTALEENHLVRLRKGSVARHLFLVHDGTGEIEGYIEFCRNLKSGMNCWGIQAERPVDYAPRNLTIEEISREYIKKIKKVQPRGPYYLAGWSIGGTIAFEVLRQLEKINEDVIFFAMIDSIPPARYPHLQENGTEFSVRSELEWLGKFLENDKVREEAGKAVELDQLWRLIVDYLEEINLDVEIIRKLIPGNMSRGIPNIDGLVLRELIYYLNVIRTFSRARDHYIPGSEVKTPVHFFAAGNGKIEKEKGWREYCRSPLDIHELKGDHFSIMEDTRAAVLAERFERVINLE